MTNQKKTKKRQKYTSSWQHFLLVTISPCRYQMIWFRIWISDPTDLKLKPRKPSRKQANGETREVHWEVNFAQLTMFFLSRSQAKTQAKAKGETEEVHWEGSLACLRVRPHSSHICHTVGFKHAHKQASGEIHKNCKPTSTPATYVTQWSLSMHTKTPGSVHINRSWCHWNIWSRFANETNKWEAGQRWQKWQLWRSPKTDMAEKERENCSWKQK